MKKLIAWLTVVIGVLLVVFAWTLGYAGTSAVWQDFIVGLVLIGISLFAALYKGALRWQWPYLVNAVLGLSVLISGIFVFGREAATNRIVDIVLGVVVILVSLLATQMVETKKGFVFTKDGTVLLEMNRLGYKDGALEAKGKAYGSVPQTMRIPPEQIWNMVGLVPLEVIIRLPKLLLLGWLKSRSAAEAKETGWKK
jgi:hypothetical protein